jgi:4-azaleucine resistance transporter AzlC
MVEQSSHEVITSSNDRVSFRLAGLLSGAKKIIPLALGDCAYGFAFGVLAQQVHLSVLEVLLMSALVFAGSAQLVALSLWTMPLSPTVIIFTTLLINLRNVLMGISISPWFLRLPRFKAYTTLFLLADENWALTMSEFEHGEHDAAFLLGSGLVMFVVWTSSTVMGRLLGNVISDPERFGLDFAFVAVILALLVNMWKGKTNLLPWIVAAIVAVITAYLLPGKWYILLGALAGSFVGTFMYTPQDEGKQREGELDAD